MAKQQATGERHWYAIHTYAGYENAVMRNLRQRIDSLGMDDKIFSVIVPTEKKIKISENTVQRKDSIISIKDIYISKLEKDKSKYWKGFWTGYKYGFGSAVVLETGALILLKK